MSRHAASSMSLDADAPLVGGDRVPGMRPLRPTTARKTRPVLCVVALLVVASLFSLHWRAQPVAEADPVHQHLVSSTAVTCANRTVPACPLGRADLDKAPQDLFRLSTVTESPTAGRPLYVEISTTTESNSTCVLESSTFSVVVSGPRIQRAQLVDASAGSLLYAVQLDEPGEYRIEAYLRLFNHPLYFCDVSDAFHGARYVDRVVEHGNTTIAVRPSWAASLPALSSSPSKRPCKYGDLYDMRGSWVEAPVPATAQGKYEKQHNCALADLPSPVEAFELARRAGIRWLRFIGDSNTRNMYDAFPLVDPANTALRSIRRTPPYNLRSSCGALHDPPSAKERNWRATRQFCRVGIVEGDPQADIFVSWEWFTPVHDPPLAAYFADDDNAYFANATLGGLFALREDDDRPGTARIEDILADRPDLLVLRGGDRVFLSYGSHAHEHTRDDMNLYIDEVAAAAERLASLEKADLSSPQRRLSFGLSTAKSCRKFKDAPKITPALLRVCHSENFHDKNLAILRAFAARGFTGPDGESVPPASRSPNLAPLDVLDFWHTTEAIEDYMTDKVHFGPGVYFTHGRVMATSAFEREV
ncbi:uncharacterized protein RHOBADRAFT_55068 [Rhodotorula graminis WP1]|uniref:Uncharacterized protein n=1 Tax=Rhodotorula graminis (strain WP1) TaxID=578459 RepID=A0A0P9EVV0_RHOGW|nr:uncharacterized protein RHOBADRAFT_55068 [Rhodotorula graminis WP1]KPV73307.1 hypothetical protein RHOBADRAFT_55068 [Rhodotorula graminis WP1]